MGGFDMQSTGQQFLRQPDIQPTELVIEEALKEANPVYLKFLKELEKSKVKLTLSQKAEWEDYFIQESKKALEIKHQIDTTDKEIDRMVYELYGLSEEEIKIVENN